MSYWRYRAESAFRDFLHGREEPLPRWHRIEVRHSLADFHFEFIAQFRGGFDIRWRIGQEELAREGEEAPRRFPFPQLYEWVCAEHRWQRDLVDRSALARTQAEFDRELRRLREPPRMMIAPGAFDPTGDELTTGTIAPPEPVDTLTVEVRAEAWRHFAQYAEAMIRAEAGCNCPACNPGAKTKSLALLKQWLSPAQLAQFERDGFFDVAGSSSGRRYRIKEGRVQNVYVLKDDQEMHGLCFVPVGNLAAGDVMLAQKIALETDEDAALKVAQRFPGAMSQAYQRGIRQRYVMPL